jgi:hypothetical protein
MQERLAGFCCLILCNIALGAYSFGASDSREPRVEQDIIDDQDATFDIGIALRGTSPPTTYERTSVGLFDTPLPVEILEMFDETRGIRAKSTGRGDTRLDHLFGPKAGLTDHVTIRAMVRVRGQPGEKIIRTTVWFRTVPLELLAKAEARGSLGVVVELDAPVNAEASLTGDALSMQREAAARAQDRLLAALEGTEYKVIRRFDVIAGCHIDASPRSLAVMDRLPYVLKVSEDMSHIIRIP